MLDVPSCLSSIALSYVTCYRIALSAWVDVTALSNSTMCSRSDFRFSDVIIMQVFVLWWSCSPLRPWWCHLSLWYTTFLLFRWKRVVDILVLEMHCGKISNYTLFFKLCIRAHIWHMMLSEKTYTFDCMKHNTPLFPPLSNLGHILCGRLGHTIALGCEGIWWTSGLSFNLNIWITEIYMWLFVMFLISLQLKTADADAAKTLLSYLMFSSFPVVVSSFVHSSISHISHHSHQFHLVVSNSFNMYIQYKLN